MSPSEHPSDRDRREWLFVCCMLVGAMAVLGALVLYGHRIFGAAW